MGNSDHGATYMRVGGDGGELRPWHYTNLEILHCDPKGRRALLRPPSTEGRSVCLCWAPSKPKGPKPQILEQVAPSGKSFSAHIIVVTSEEKGGWDERYPPPYALHPSACTLGPEPYTPNPTPHTLHPNPTP